MPRAGDQDHRRASRRVISVLIISVVSLWLLVGLGPAVLAGWPSRAGEFGDMFGAVNALFSGLAFVGVVYAILLQADELRLQREELALQREELRLNRGEMAASREELAGQKQQLEIQNRTATRQAFENTFFQMIGQLHMFSSNLIESGPPPIYGRACFANWQWKLREYYRQLPPGERSRRTFGAFNYGREHSVGLYLGHLYETVRFILDSGVEDPVRYAAIMRAQLSSAELVLIGYFCAAPEGERLKAIVQQFAFLRHVPTNDDLFPPEMQDAVGLPAFQTTNPRLQ